MTSFRVDAGQPWDEVRRYLTGALPDCDVTSESLVSDQPPMIFTWMTHVMAGFAFSNGDTGVSYEKLFGGFKQYYTEHRSRLDALELSFVFCVQPDLPNFEKFSSRVETDLYFCRKFVVPLAEDLDKSFYRLPFIPLASGAGRLQRPPSAQTYMLQCDVAGTLAKYLAVPHQRGAENIVKDCLDETSNWMPILGTPSRTKMSVVNGRHEEEETVRLESVAIQGFRAYRKRQVFDLGAAVTVLYGPNGFGKTSFFDAIDFAATGGVGRLGVSASTERFAKAVTHLDSEPSQAVVDLRFIAKGVARNITRRVGNRAQALLDGSTHDRKKALVEVTGGGLEPADRVEHLVSLFRATHLFSQGQPELGRGFDRDCTLPPQVVSHILAFDDYANARRKASDVCDVFQEMLREATQNVEILRQQIEEAELTIGSVEQASTGYEYAASPDEALASLRRRVGETGLVVPDEETDRLFVRACRAAIQAQLSAGEAQIRRLTALVEEVRTLPSAEENLAELEKRLDRAERERRSAGDSLRAAVPAHTEATARLRELKARRVAEGERAQALRWVQETQPRYRGLLALEAERAKALESAVAALRPLRERQQLQRRELRDKEGAAEKLAAKVASARSVATELGRLAEAAESWRSDLTWVREARARDEALVGELESLRREEGTLSSRLIQHNASRTTLLEQIESSEREQSVLSQLLGQVETHIRDGLCPLCGYNHGSTEVLRAQVEKRRVQDAVAGLRQQLVVLRESGEKLEKRLAEVRGNAAVQSKEAEKLRDERQTRERRIAGFEEALAKVGIAAAEPTATVGELNERWAQERANIEAMENTRAALWSEVEGGRERAGELSRQIENADQTILEMERELDNCRNQLETVRDDQRAAVVSLDAEATTLREDIDRQMEHLARTETAIADTADAAKENTDAVNALRKRASSLANTLDGLKKAVGTRRRAVAETNAQLLEFGLAVGAEEGQVAHLLEEETTVHRRLVELLEFADAVEVAMDTATTAAALQRQRQAIRDKQREIEETKRHIEQYESWLRFFTNLSAMLAGEQNATVARFADQYGPTASAIQGRLRSVYGFEGIDTRSHEATIRVRVTRGGQSLRPTDYFSDSQQRTLLLGLFLTASISQSWSSLSTVLLDDPVMHFDDLNTYALLDMVAGFFDARTGPRQFIISTCDRKVLQLARNRFRHLGADARFYEFNAIGRDGPVVEEIAAV